MADPHPLRAQLARLLDWEEAHVGLRRALAGIPPSMRGRVAEGLPYSAWQLLEHLRRAQRDLLDFCTREDYEHLAWPDDYWPAEPAPPDDAAWDRAVRALDEDLAALKAHALDPGVDLLAPVPTGTEGQTHLRSLLLAADHTAYHTGQLVALRRVLGLWPPPDDDGI